MRQVLLYSILLIAGLIGSQFVDGSGEYPVKWLTMLTLAFIMIHVGHEFDIDKSRPRRYAWDYVVAATAAAFPWLFCALYFVFALAPPELWSHPDQWKEALLGGRFASPTSAGVLFSMLLAAGLAHTWVFKKARILAIFDDLDTILLMIPLVFLMVGFRWQLMVLVFFMLALLWLAWRHLHAVRLPVSWPFVMLYAGLITLGSEAIYLGSRAIDPQAPVHLEVLLPAFVVGCMLAHPKRPASEAQSSPSEPSHGHESPVEKRVATIVAASFMVLVGLSMPPLFAGADANESGVAAAADAELSARNEPVSALAFEGVSADVLAAKDAMPSWGVIALHVLIITVVSNLGKMFPVFCYRREASLRERIAVAVCMFPRGEVGAGVLVVSLSYGLGGPAVTVAVLSLALNLLCTGIFILVVRRLLVGVEAAGEQKDEG